MGSECVGESAVTKEKRSLLWALGSAMLLAVVLAPILLAMRAAFPAADDFVYATRTHASWLAMHSLPHVLVDAWRYALQIYRTWQGTLTGAIVMSLHPAVFDLHAYWLHVPVLLACFLGGTFFAVRTMCAKVFGLSKAAGWTLWALLTVVQLTGMPDLLEGIFWYNSAWLYTFAHNMLLIMLPLAVRLADWRGTKRALAMVLLWGLCAFLGMSNYITAVLATVSLALVIAYRFFTDRKQAWPLLIAWALLAAGLIASVIAPGNAVRLEVDGRFHAREPWMLLSMVDTVWAACWTWGAALSGTALGALCAAGLYIGYVKITISVRRRLWLVPLCAFLLLCAMIFPHMYTSGFSGTPRVKNLYFFYVTFASLALCLLAGACARRVRIPHPGRWAIGATCALLALAWLLPASNSYPDLVAAHALGEVGRYRVDMRRLFTELERAAPGSDAVVRPVYPQPAALAVQPLSDDPAAWRNQAVADYFGLHSARIEGDAPR